MTDVIYDEMNGRADVIVSHDGLCKAYDDPQADGYSTGFAAAIFRDGWWSGGCSPIMEREVVQRLIEQQNAYIDANDFDGRLSWDGDVLVLSVKDDDDIRSEPTPDGYNVGFGWTWTPVDYAECDEVIGDAPRIVQARFTFPQSLLDKYGEDDLIASVQARLDEFYPGDGDCYVTPHVEVAVVQ
jgi:hypothetical protein